LVDAGGRRIPSPTPPVKVKPKLKKGEMRSLLHLNASVYYTEPQKRWRQCIELNDSLTNSKAAIIGGLALKTKGIIRGPNQTALWNWLQNQYEETGSPVVPYSSRNIGAILNRPLTEELIQQSSTILSSLASKGLLKVIRDKGNQRGIITGVELLMKQSGRWNLVPIETPSRVQNIVQNIYGADIPSPTPAEPVALKPAVLDRSLAASNENTTKIGDTKYKNALANAKKFRSFYLEEKGVHPELNHSMWFNNAYARFHERVESGHFRYIVGYRKNQDFSPRTCRLWLKGRITGSRIGSELPSLVETRKTVKTPGAPPALNELVKQLEGLRSIDLSDLPTKKDMAELRGKMDSLSTDFERLVYALWAGGKEGTKTTLHKWFGGAISRLQQQQSD